MATIDLNADLAEGGSQDAAMMKFVSSCNIACGGHAGDEGAMRRAVEQALRHGVAIGAHPGYEDRQHFGRRPMELAAAEVAAMLERQLGRLLAISPAIHHVKPHGALYHQANADPALAGTVTRTIAGLLPGCRLYAPPTGALAEAAVAAGLNHCAEGFIDRRYRADGQLLPRDRAGALIEEPNEAAAQALGIVLDHQVVTDDHRRIPLSVRTLCVHGDSPQACITLERSCQALRSAGIHIGAV